MRASNVTEMADGKKLTDVDNVPFAIYHYITIMSILNLQYVTSDRISSHRLDEIKSCFLKWDRIFAPIFGDEEVKEIIDFRPSHFIPRSRVWNDIDDAALQNG
jgi:hypothetical protein